MSGMAVAGDGKNKWLISDNVNFSGEGVFLWVPYNVMTLYHSLHNMPVGRDHLGITGDPAD